MTIRCRVLAACACVALAAPLAWAEGDAPITPATAPAPAGGYNYPTQGRVEYVLSCMDDNGHDFANVYKCSCVIDKMATTLSYEDFVDQSTFSKYATLGGEGGSEFRVDQAKAQTKKFRTLQAEAYHSCGLGHDKTASAK
ncbi:hypothetical protein [Paraburkholderia sp. DHOC27]|uniref:hypothetical protein n=1 Tax=Paraburkholderia sp. DHOC27 TaxID=2303330 RepID=UPI000E3BC336|nr:hypothetical protein [Paraburkholderia sp. DHOC27]RFU49344.1 hypothetical protein D0B32_05970 [Paraburkholderia sp. DHOC27]